MGVFHLKVRFSQRKSGTKFLCVKTVSGKVAMHSFAYLTVQKRLVGTLPSTWKFGRNSPTLHPLKNADCQSVFQSIFVRSADQQYNL